MPLIDLKQSTIDDLKAALAALPGESPGPTPTPPTPPAQPPIVSTDGDWQERARVRAAQQGFDHAVLFDWDWARGNQVFDSAYRGQVGAAGVFVCSFVPTEPAEHDNLAQLDVIGYPAPPAGRQLTIALSTTPCDFTNEAPWKSVGEAPTLWYGVGTVSVGFFTRRATAAALIPGLRYFINVAGIDADGGRTFQPGEHGTPEFRVAMRVPAGH